MRHFNRSNPPSPAYRPFQRMQMALWLALFVALVVNTACAHTNGVRQVTFTPQPNLVLYDWVDYMPQAVLDKFQAETGVKVIYKTYDSTEEADDTITHSTVDFDVALVDDDLIPNMAASGVLAEIDHHHLTNFKNISPNFRELLYDPNNRFSVPNGWGTTGLLVRSDLVAAPINGWADLWDPRYSGKILIREQRDELITIALKSLGYHVNSEDPAELEAALSRLLVLKKRATLVGVEAEAAVAPLLEGKAVILAGWSGDAIYARSKNASIKYIVPREGTMLWGDSYIISARSQQKAIAERFIDFLLRPEIAAEVIETYSYPNAIEGSRSLIDPVLAQDPIFYPPQAVFDQGEWYMPLSPQGKQLYEKIWQRFQAGE